MALPSQVDEAAELAEKLHQKIFNHEPVEIEEPDVQDDIEDDDEEEEEIEDTKDDDTPHDDDLEELRKFKARYLSLKGKYDAEVPRLHRDLNDLKTSVFEKLNSLAENSPQTKEEANKSDDVISRLKDEYGNDFIDSVKLIAEQIAEEKIKNSLTPMQEKVLSVEDTQIKVAQDAFKSHLDTAVKGNWRELWEGKDSKFIEFLGSSDPSGLYTYGELVQLYNDNWEADKLATVFNTYLGTKKTKKPVETSSNPTRDALVAPSRIASHTTPDTNDKMIWTKDAISEFQRLDRQGKFTPEESKEKWNDLLAAASEGRIH